MKPKPLTQPKELVEIIEASYQKIEEKFDYLKPNSTVTSIKESLKNSSSLKTIMNKISDETIYEILVLIIEKNLRKKYLNQKSLTRINLVSLSN